MLVASLLFFCEQKVTAPHCDASCSFLFFSTAIIVGSVIGGLIFTCIVISCIVFACRRRQSSPGRVIATNTSTGVPQLNPPYPSQVPPAFQQTYPCYPPPQLEQQQTFTPPPPYNHEATELSEPLPPSYIEATQGRSEGVYTLSDPLPSPSAPPPMD